MALALTALCEIGNEDMCRSLTTEIEKIIKTGNIYTMKKAALAATRIIRKVPSLANSYVDYIQNLLKQRNHGVFLSTLGLINVILTIKPQLRDKFKNYLQIMVKVQKNLVGSYSAEFDVSGVFDPFL